MRYRDIKERGFDILTNDGFTPDKIEKIEGPCAKPPMKVWNAARKTCNEEFMSDINKQ